MLHNGCCYTVFILLILDALFLLQLCLLCFAIQFKPLLMSPVVYYTQIMHDMGSTLLCGFYTCIISVKVSTFQY